MSFIDGGGKSPNDAYNKPGELFDYAWSSYKGAMKWSPVPDAVSPAAGFQALAPARRSAGQQVSDKECPPPAAAFER